MLHNFIKNATTYDIQHKHWGLDLITSYEIIQSFSKRGNGEIAVYFLLYECPSRQRTVRPNRMGAYALDTLQSGTQERIPRKQIVERMFLWAVFIFILFFVLFIFYFVIGSIFYVQS